MWPCLKHYGLFHLSQKWRERTGEAENEERLKSDRLESTLYDLVPESALSKVEAFYL